MNNDEAKTVIAAIEGYYSEMVQSKAFLFAAALAEYPVAPALESVHRWARTEKWPPTLADLLSGIREVQAAAPAALELPDVTWTQEEETAARDAALASYAEFRAANPEHYGLVDESLGTGTEPKGDGESTEEDTKGGDMTAETIREPSVPSRDTADETEAPTP